MLPGLTKSRQWSRLLVLRQWASTVANSSPDGIAPPVRIKRSPTDILEALAATVGLDPTAPHYKYHDDPYLSPLSNKEKRAYALATEAGRKAALWVRDQHPELFTERVWDPPLRKRTPYHNAEPPVPALMPRPVYTDESKVTEADLRYTIEHALVEDAARVCRLLGGSGALSTELRRALLQLLAFYNEGGAGATAEWLEERWFSQSQVGQNRQAVSWKLGGLAEEIFNSLEEKDSVAYCALIQGMAKYGQAERAHALAAEARSAGVPLCAGTYGALAACVGFLRDGAAARQQALVDTLTAMRDQGLSMNGETLVSCLGALAKWGAAPALRKLALALLAEARALHVQPPLAAYAHALNVFCKDQLPPRDVLSSILQELESRPQLTPTHPLDTNFFITAMATANEHLQDLELGERVHALLLRPGHYRLLGDAYKESIYYRHYMTLLCRRAPLERLTEVLDTLVPNVYVPEPSLMHEIVNALAVGGAAGRLARVWSQLVVFGQAKKSHLVEKLLREMLACYQIAGEEDKRALRRAAADVITWHETAEAEMAEWSNNVRPHRLSSGALSACVTLCCLEGAGEAATGASTEAARLVWGAAAAGARRLAQGDVAAAGAPYNARAAADAAVNAARAGEITTAELVLRWLAEAGCVEARDACVRALGVVLAREPADVLELCRRPRAQLEGKLQPQALGIVDAYLASVALSGGEQAEGAAARGASDSSTSSDSSSDSDSDHDSRK